MTAEPAGPGSSGPNAASGRKRVLIVEDNPLNMKLFAAMLSAQGYHVLEAGDGPHGLAMARRERPDLIVMDLQLPGLSGLEVARALKADAATSDIPIIATSAYALPGEAEPVRASGVDAFMAKPIAISEFLDMIEAFIAAGHQGGRAGRPAPVA